MPPPEIEGYSDLTQIAKGGFGVVYRAHQDRLDRTVALKVLAVSDLTDRDLQRFDRECRAMGALSWHPNVVAVLDSGVTADGNPYLAMEYLPAGSLADRLRRGPMPWAEVVEAGVEVAGALGAAHAAGTLHRDLKPENILVDAAGTPKLADLGVAREMERNTKLTEAGSILGTYQYVAPEQILSSDVSPAADLYSLGICLFEAVTGELP